MHDIDQPAEDEIDERIHGVTTMDECLASMDRVGTLPAYLREPIIKLATESLEKQGDGDEDPPLEANLDLEKIQMDEKSFDEDFEMHTTLSDEELEKLKDNWSAKDEETMKSTLSAYLLEDGLNEEDMKKVALDSHDLAKSYLGFRTWWINNRLVFLRRRCLQGR